MFEEYLEITNWESNFITLCYEIKATQINELILQKRGGLDIADAKLLTSRKWDMIFMMVDEYRDIMLESLKIIYTPQEMAELVRVIKESPIVLMLIERSPKVSMGCMDSNSLVDLRVVKACAQAMHDNNEITCKNWLNHMIQTELINPNPTTN
jgi:hypothetical protein